MSRKPMAAALVAAAFLLGVPPAQAADGPVVIKGATLIDGTGRRPIADATIVIDGGRIVAAGPRAAVSAPAGAKEIDATGKFVIPGLMDANVHLVLGSAIEFIVRYEGRYEDLIEFNRRLSNQ